MRKNLAQMLDDFLNKGASALGRLPLEVVAFMTVRAAGHVSLAWGSPWLALFVNLPLHSIRGNGNS